MLLKVFYFSLVLLLISISCNKNNPDRFDIKIAYSSSWGPECIYYLNENEIKVLGNQKNKWTTVYQRKLNIIDRDTILFYLNNIKFDTLRTTYDNNSWSDGTTVNYTIQLGNSSPKKVMIYMTSTMATDSLEKLLRKYILDAKYKEPFWVE